MLVGKGQWLDLEIVTYAQHVVGVNAEGMCSQFRVKASIKAAESVSVVGFYREMCVELTDDCFDDLVDRVVEAREGFWALFFWFRRGLVSRRMRLHRQRSSAADALT